jgi:predicted MPP superfamily phosphohydrolase|tara:strand:+ start:102 stop:863 length:762 start_codon:yes stop_codon:yes gene_type:complete
MKTVYIGDIHHRDIWKKVVEKESDADRIVFIGDYFDSFDIPHTVGISNFKEIVKFKAENPKKVVLLVGNHDTSYLLQETSVSGYNYTHSVEIKYLLETALRGGLIQLAHLENNVLSVHAGITETFVKRFKKKFIEQYGFEPLNTLEALETVLEDKSSLLKFAALAGEDSSMRMSFYGDDIWQSPVWVRPDSLAKDMWRGFTYTQVVGHTMQQNGIEERITNGQSIWLIDALLGSNPEYLVLEDNKFEKRTIKQ